MRIVAGQSPARSAKGKVPVSAPAQARFTLALAGGKAAGAAARALGVGGGTSFPGIVARRIDPRVLQKAVAGSDARTVVVTGSNGKTTTCRMLAALAAAEGLRVAQNRSGSNLLQGVTSAAVRDAGRQRARIGAPQQAADEITAAMPRGARVKEDVKCAS